MKRMMKLSLTALVMGTTFLANPDPENVLAIEVVDKVTERDLAVEIVISKVEAYLDDYSEEFAADNADLEELNPKEYIINRLTADNYTVEEITEIFEVMAEKRQAELVALIADNLEKEPLLSKKELLKKLPADTYSDKEIADAIKSLNTDWKEQAIKASEAYINTELGLDDEVYSVISRKCLRNFLIEEKEFTLVEANYAIEEAGIDWTEQAVKQAKDYLAGAAYSKKELTKQLIADEFTKEEAEYGVTRTQTDWKSQAFKKAENYLVHSPLQSKEGLQNYLRQEGFATDEIDYVISQLFIEEEESDSGTEVEVEKEAPSIKVPELITPERSIVIKPIEFITGPAVTSARAAENTPVAEKDKIPKDSKAPTPNYIRSSQKKTTKVADNEVEEETEEVDEESFFDNPIFLPVAVLLIVGNLYLFQKN